MAKVITFANPKGGVAKTTTALTVAKELARRKEKVLLVDIDPQATLSMILAVRRNKGEYTIQNWLQNTDEQIEFDNIVEHLKDLDLMPSNILLYGSEQILQTLDNNANLLSKKISEISGKYDYIIIDCPPSLGLLMKNAIMASDYIIIPVKPEVASLLGVDKFVNLRWRLSKSYNNEINVLGVLFTMCNTKTSEYKEIKEFMQNKLKALNIDIFSSAIRQSVMCSNWIGCGENVIEKEAKSGVAQDYQRFVDEMLKKIEIKENINKYGGVLPVTVNVDNLMDNFDLCTKKVVTNIEKEVQVCHTASKQKTITKKETKVKLENELYAIVGVNFKIAVKKYCVLNDVLEINLVKEVISTLIKNKDKVEIKYNIDESGKDLSKRICGKFSDKDKKRLLIIGAEQNITIKMIISQAVAKKIGWQKTNK